MPQTSFGEALDLFNGALLLRRHVLERVRDSAHPISQGLLVVLLVGLIVGGVGGVRTLLFHLNPETTVRQVQTELERSIDQQARTATTLEQRTVLGLVSENLEPAMAIVQQVVDLPTPLPRPISALFHGLGTVASMPLSYLSGLLFAVVLTHIAASWFGGRGSIQPMIGLGALSVAPHALDALRFIPFLGSLVGLLAWGWSVVILVVATSMVHQMDTGRATLAVLFFPLIGMLLVFLGCCLFFAIIAMAGASAVS